MKETKKAKLLRKIIEQFQYWLKEYNQKVIDYELAHFEDNYAHLWVVLKDGNKQWLDMFSLAYGKKEDSWSFSDAYSEEEGPLDYSCPLRLLEITPESINPYFCDDWRERVIKFWKGQE